jgi:hypothetical protein
MIKQVKTFKIISIIILSTLSIILCFILVINILGYRSNIANGITGTDIKEIEVGMTLEEVISILGQPYEIHTLAGLHDFSCKNPKPRLEMNVDKNTDIVYVVDNIFNATDYCCDGNEEDIRRGKRVTLTYTQPVRLSKYYPMLWVHLDSNYRVWSVFAKRYKFMDNICIYSLSSQNDTTIFQEIPDKTELFINDELFNKCFKSKK